MSRSIRARAKGQTLAVLASAGLVAATLSTAGAASAAPSSSVAEKRLSAAQPAETFEDGRYVVTLIDPPAAAYTGDKGSFARTKPAKGKKFDANSPASRAYRAHLKSQHDRLLAKVGAAAYHDYTISLNGFAAELTGKQAAALAKERNVLSVAKDELAKPTTNYSPEFLELSDGLWRDAGGREKSGEGVIVGIIDTGIWPENPSFAGTTAKRNRAGLPADAEGVRQQWRGTCEAGEQFSVQSCNDKLIGARFYVDGFGKQNIAKEEYLSPRDGNGHGSHTAGTAAGNVVENVTVDGTKFGTISGMAPAAKIAAYKVCWTGKTDDGCANSDSVAAIEDAVADGVDVINYSIGSSSESPVADPVELAFLGAAEANVFVAASAGNSGPGASTLDHPSPWVTTVAASTYKVSEKKLVLGNGEQFIGVSTTGTLGQTPMIRSTDAAAAGVSADQAAICNTNTLDPAKVQGKLVVCERRGLIARIAKSFEVARAGGAGMVLVNNPSSSLNGDLHAVPSVHLDADALKPVYDYVTASGNPVGSIVELADGESTAEVPGIADFSSRGPSTTTGGDVLKPDVSAPGVDVLAAVAPPSGFGRSYDLKSGTSMASPHIAGLGAALYSQHRDWSPIAIKSALMTTAGDHADTTNPFQQGAGFVEPNGANDPGVVFEHGVKDWFDFLAGLGYRYADGTPLSDTPIDPSDLNQASIAIGQLAGRQTVTRTLHNVTATDETFTPTVDGLEGIDVDVEKVDVPAGESVQVKITFTRGSAEANKYVTGYLTWTGDKGHTARMPVALRPLDVAAPVEVHGQGTGGDTTFDVTAGFTGDLGARTAGLVGATPVDDSVTTGAFDYNAPAPSDAADRREYKVPAGTQMVRFDVDAANEAADDLDLWVYLLSGGKEHLIGYSAKAGGDEQWTYVGDAAGATLVTYVHGYSTPAGGAYKWTNWAVGDVQEGNLGVELSDQDVAAGEKVEATVSWSGLQPDQRYLGWVEYTNGDVPAGRTIVSVN